MTLLYDKREIKKILIIRNDNIGDIVTSSGLIKEIKCNFRKAHITFVASPLNKPLVEKNPNVDKLITLKSSPRRFSDFIRYLKAMIKIRKGKYDLSIDFRGGFFGIFFLSFLPSIKYRIGFANQSIGTPLLHEVWPKEKETSNSAILRRNLLNKSLGLKIKNYWPDIVTDKEDKIALFNLLKKYKLKNFICVAPDAFLEFKQWSIENFDILIKNISKKYPSHKIVLVGSNREKIKYLKKRNPQVITLINENLRVIYLLFKKASATIAHDGGPMHMAWAGNAKLIALLEKTLPFEWVKPLGENSRYIHKDIKKISVKEIENLVDYFLDKK